MKKKRLQESFTGVEKKKEKSVSPTKKMVIIGIVIEGRKKGKNCKPLYVLAPDRNAQTE